MMLPTLQQIQEAQATIYRYMPPTPQYTWPLINQRLGAEAWIKHVDAPVFAKVLAGDFKA
jgi:threonine dehydratase